MCSFYLSGSNDSFRGETEGTTCSFPLRRPVERWKLKVTRGQILVTVLPSGKTHRLVRSGSSGSEGSLAAAAISGR